MPQIWWQTTFHLFSFDLLDLWNAWHGSCREARVLESYRDAAGAGSCKGEGIGCHCTREVAARERTGSLKLMNRFHVVSFWWLVFSGRISIEVGGLVLAVCGKYYILLVSTLPEPHNEVCQFQPYLCGTLGHLVLTLHQKPVEFVPPSIFEDHDTATSLNSPSPDYFGYPTASGESFPAINQPKDSHLEAPEELISALDLHTVPWSQVPGRLHQKKLSRPLSPNKKKHIFFSVRIIVWKLHLLWPNGVGLELH